MAAVILFCTVMVNLLWLGAITTWPRISLEYTIMLTILFSSLATVLAGWMVIA